MDLHYITVQDTIAVFLITVQPYWIKRKEKRHLTQYRCSSRCRADCVTTKLDNWNEWQDALIECQLLNIHSPLPRLKVQKSSATWLAPYIVRILRSASRSLTWNGTSYITDLRCCKMCFWRDKSTRGVSDLFNINVIVFKSIIIFEGPCNKANSITNYEILLRNIFLFL